MCIFCAVGRIIQWKSCEFRCTDLNRDGSRKLYLHYPGYSLYILLFMYSSMPKCRRFSWMWYKQQEKKINYSKRLLYRQNVIFMHVQHMCIFQLLDLKALNLSKFTHKQLMLLKWIRTIICIKNQWWCLILVYVLYFM